MANSTRQKAQLAAVALILVAWMAWLASQAWTRGRFPVVSQSQLLMSTLGVVAEVTTRDGQAESSVVVKEILWPNGRDELVNQSIQVTNMATVTLPGLRSLRESGRYVLPLLVEDGKYAVAGIPKSPGFAETNAHFVYPDTPLIRQQIANFAKH